MITTTLPVTITIIVVLLVIGITGKILEARKRHHH